MAADLKKGDEVAEQFGVLIQQQESQPQQPEFVQPYLRLGDLYEKSGNAEFAAQIWKRGAALFPDDAQLKTALAWLTDHADSQSPSRQGDPAAR